MNRLDLVEELALHTKLDIHHSIMLVEVAEQKNVLINDAQRLVNIVGLASQSMDDQVGIVAHSLEYLRLLTS